MGLVVVILAFLLAGCPWGSYRLPPTLHTKTCDPITEDCFSVSYEFLQEHFELVEKLSETRKALHHCQEKI